MALTVALTQLSSSSRVKSHLDNRRFKTNPDDALRTLLGRLYQQFNRRQAKE